PDPHRDTLVLPEVRHGLAAGGALPPREVVSVQHHRAAAIRQVRRAVAGGRDQRCRERALVVGARVVHDLRKLSEVYAGDGRRTGRGSCGHRRDAIRTLAVTSASATNGTPPLGHWRPWTSEK